jgi:hypothetical protein
MTAPVDKLAATSLVRLSRYLDNRFAEEGESLTVPGQWIHFELETIVDDLTEGQGLAPELLTEKIEVLRTLWANPHFFYENILGFIAVCDVVNGVPHDFETLILPNSLEMVAAVVEVQDVLNDWKLPLIPFTNAMKEGIAKLLIEDGFDKSPLDFIHDSYFTEKSGNKEAAENKIKAIQIYMKHMAEK